MLVFSTLIPRSGINLISYCLISLQLSGFPFINCVDRLWSFSAYGWCYTSSLKALERFNVVSQHPHVQHARTAMPLGLKGDPSQAPVYCYLNCNSQPFFYQPPFANVKSVNDAGTVSSCLSQMDQKRLCLYLLMVRLQSSPMSVLDLLVILYS